MLLKKQVLPRFRRPLSPLLADPNAAFVLLEVPLCRFLSFTVQLATIARQRGEDGFQSALAHLVIAGREEVPNCFVVAASATTSASSSELLPSLRRVLLAAFTHSFTDLEASGGTCGMDRAPIRACGLCWGCHPRAWRVPPDRIRSTKC